MIKQLGLLAIILLGIIFLSKNFFSVSSQPNTGNPNLPPPQPNPMIGPQGPNDGSNNTSGTGHFYFEDANLAVSPGNLPVVGNRSDYLTNSALPLKDVYQNAYFV